MRLIDADELYILESHTQIGCDKIHGIQPRSTYQEMYEMGWNNALKAAEKGMPTIDAVEVVRCKECKRWKDPRDYECPYHTSGDPHIDDDPEEDFFCKLGERREDE